MCVDNGQHNHIIDSSIYFLMLKNDVIFFLNIYQKSVIFHKYFYKKEPYYMLILQKIYH